MAALLSGACTSPEDESTTAQSASLAFSQPVLPQLDDDCLLLSDTLSGPTELAAGTLAVEKDVISQLAVRVRSSQSLDLSVEMAIETEQGEVAITLGSPQDIATVTAEVAAPEAAEQIKVRFIQARDAEQGTEWCLVGLNTIPTNKKEETRSPQLLTNQVGYLSSGPRRAVLRGAGTEPVDWQLLEENSGEVSGAVATGRSRLLGTDPASGLFLHEIDLTDVTATGDSFVLATGLAQSHPFAIDDAIYQGLVPQPVGFLYGNRSGHPISNAYSAGQERPPGHVNDPPNQGDLEVPCLPYDHPAQGLYDEPWSCEGTTDVSGGWYDAGDYGKYVTPGAVATAQLLRAVETSDYWRQAGALPPSAGRDSVPDLLEEAQWQLDFLLKMQVTDRGVYDGMAYHKVTGTEWPPSKVLPHQDPTYRVVYRPSTQATLALAAITAQASRVFRAYDSKYADRLIAASVRAYEAGLREPELYPPAQDDSVVPNPGGGAYADQDARDELFWASAELYLTTGESKYADAVQAQGDEQADSEVGAGGADFYWANMEGFAVLQLARAAEDRGLREAMEARLIRVADEYLAERRSSKWSVPYSPGGSIFDWGSNTIILSRMQLLGTAYDLTGNRQYAEAVTSAMDYLLGTNPAGVSYVTSWGENAVQNPHGALFSDAVEADRSAPPGTLVGGPNTGAVGTGDTAAVAQLGGCIGLTCHLDVSGSWSTNEPTIYGNAALVAAVTFVSDWSQRDGQQVDPLSRD